MFNKLKGGVRPEIIGEGFHFYIPIISKPITFETRCRPKMISSHTGTKVKY